MAESWSVRVRKMRVKLKLHQQHFASLLGVSFVSINRWERGAAEPTGLSAVMLELIGDALDLHPREAVLHALRDADTNPVRIVRALAWLVPPPSRPQAASSPPTLGSGNR